MEPHLPSPLDWIEGELSNLVEHGLLRQLQSHAGPQGPTLQVAGQTLLNFGSNDYLGLAADPRLAAAAKKAVTTYGSGAGASPLVTGHSSIHAELETALADFEAAQAALVFTSGYAANVGVIAALVGRGDQVFADQKNHASLIDGCRLSRAETHIYPHGNADALANLLQQTPRTGRRLIATDSLFSMDGDVAPLQQLASLAEQFDCMLLVDEAHATGVYGEHGRGLVEALGLENRVHARVGTLSKALGSIGGFVVGSRLLIDWLVNRARTYVFSTALPPAVCAASLAALRIVRDEPWRRRQLLEHAGWLHARLQTQGWATCERPTQILPLIVQTPQRCTQLATELRRRGFWVPAIRPPSVPAGESLLRISLSAAHTPEMLESLATALAELRPMSGGTEMQAAPVGRTAERASSRTPD